MSTEFEERRLHLFLTNDLESLQTSEAAGSRSAAIPIRIGNFHFL